MKLKKVITIIVTILFLSINTICFAKVDTQVYKPNDLNQSDYGKVFDIAGTIATVLTTVGTVIAVVGIIVLGIKYMMGTVEQKAEYKKTMIPYIIGCIFIFAIGTIVSIIYNIASQL